MKRWCIFALLTLGAAPAFAQTKSFSFPFAEAPEQIAAKEAEQQDLQRALAEAQTSTIDMVRSLEAHLEKYPKSERRTEIEAALTKASIDNRDAARIVKYGEKFLELTPDDVLVLDRVSDALLALGGEENARKALTHARYFEDLIDGMGLADGKDAVQRQEERERARGRTILYQAKARAAIGDADEAVRQTERAFDVYPNEESAREWANALIRVGKEKEAVSRLAEAFSIPDSHTTDQQRLDDRIQLGKLFVNLTGSEKGLGDLILEAYDHSSTIVEVRRKKLLAMDPNSTLADPMEFTVTGLDGNKMQLASLKGKIVVMDFWATWCAPCKVQHPLYEQVRESFGERDDLVFLALNTDEDRSVVTPFLEQQKWDKTVYFDDGLSRLLQVSSIPTTILIDKQGRVASRMNGFAADTFVEQLMRRIGGLMGIDVSQLIPVRTEVAIPAVENPAVPAAKPEPPPTTTAKPAAQIAAVPAANSEPPPTAVAKPAVESPVVPAAKPEPPTVSINPLLPCRDQITIKATADITAFGFANVDNKATFQTHTEFRAPAGTTIEFKGRVMYRPDQILFEGDQALPLLFRVEGDQLVYQKGRGTITLSNGEKYRLPCP